MTPAITYNNYQLMTDIHTISYKIGQIHFQLVSSKLNI